MNNQKTIELDAQASEIQRTLIRQVYLWMFGALMLTGLVAYIVASSPTLFMAIVGSKVIFYGLMIGELALVWYLAARVSKMSLQAAAICFVVYSILNGLTLSVIFMAYTMASIATTFFATAATFGAMSLYGYFTKKDLTSWGNILFMALIGLIIASIVNLFWANSVLYWIVTYAGILIFVGLTAYDTQKIKKYAEQQTEVSDHTQKYAIMGALSLYLDFINLFLYLLRILGNSRN